MGDHHTGKFLAKALASTARQTRELDLPEVNTAPGTRLDWQTDGPPGPIEYRLTKQEQRQHELARAVESIDKEVRSMRAEQIRMREIMTKANMLNRQVADALEALAQDKTGEQAQVESLRRWRARVVGIAVGATAVISAGAWVLERILK